MCYTGLKIFVRGLKRFVTQNWFVTKSNNVECYMGLKIFVRGLK